MYIGNGIKNRYAVKPYIIFFNFKITKIIALPKAKLILIVFFYLCFFGKAQQHLFNDNHWMTEEMRVYSFSLQEYSYKYYFVNGDSLYSGNNYKKIYVGAKNCGQSIMNPFQLYPCPNTPYYSSYVGLLRELNQVWYFIGSTTLNEKILYRFDLAKGDTLYDQVANDFVTIDSVIPNYLPNRKLFRIARDLNAYSDNAGFIEGIGPTTGFLAEFSYFYPFESSSRLKCATANNMNMQYGSGPGNPQYGYIAYHCESWPQLILGIFSINAEPKNYFYPNPTSQLLVFKNAPYALTNKLLIYDCNGALVLAQENVTEYQSINVSDLKNGIYFAEMDYGTYRETLKFVKE